ncbi:MAG: FAD-dependent oxidoreductase [Dictyoglomaceae bacterium]|nr:FAD-dependent oxidoreductase [Dictyoglomaceae bacterium]
MYLIIGNGISGINTAEVIREKDKGTPILIITEEKYPYYSRPQIIEFLAGNIKEEELSFYPKIWYEKNKIEVLYEEKALKIDGNRKILETDKEKYKFAKLLIATGALPFKPPLDNINVEGVFTLRNIDDAKNILSFIKDKDKAIILGCGLLGLEIGRALSQRGLKITGLEFFPRLIPKQLDEEGARILKKKIEERFNFEFYLGVKAQKILSSHGKFKGIELEDGRRIYGDLLIVSAGIIPNIDLAKNSEISVNKGIIVNEYMETNIKDIFSCGDCVEFNGRIYGIIPASLEQSLVAGKNMIGEKIEYKGTIPSNTLKVTGIDLTSIGEIDPPKEKGFEVIIKKDEERGFYRKLVLKERVIVGAILLGDKRKYVNKIQNFIREKRILEGRKELIDED